MPEARCETVHRMTRRCEGWDYRQRAIYQITLVQADRRQPALGRLVIDDPTAPPDAVTARVEPSELGAAILAHWKRLGDFTPEIKPLFCQLMPDHLHAILDVTRPLAKPLGNAIGGFKTGCERIYRELALSAQNRAVCGGRACLVPEARASGVPRLWAPGFQDSILFRAGQLDAMFNYLRDNPRRLAVKRLYPNLFRAVGALRRPLPGLGGVGAFAALGNRFLLDRPLVQVQVSRRDFTYRREPKRGGGLKITRDTAGVPAVATESAAFAAKAEALLARARQGAVLLSPCVSDGEREIARRAFAESLPLVVLRNKGFAPLEKPGGRYFDACADGQLLMLAPAAWPHVLGEKPMTRRDALVLNRLAQALAEGAPKARAFGTGQGASRAATGTGASRGSKPGARDGAPGSAVALDSTMALGGAAKISYRGVTFAEVDDWARAAVNLAPRPRAYPVPEARACSVPEPRARPVPEARASGNGRERRAERFCHG